MIYVNTRNLASHLTGVQRYTLEITSEWRRNRKEFIEIKPSFSFGKYSGHLWEQCALPFKVEKHSILWNPSNTGPIMHDNQIVTIHDTVPFDHPEWLNKKFVAWYKFLQPRLAKRVSKIITISEFSKERIIHYFKVPEHKVHVVYNGVDIKTPSNIEHSNIISTMPFDKYILCVGSVEPRKNVGRLISAWATLETRYPEFGLVIVGAKGLERVFASDNSDKCDSRAQRVYFTGHVSDVDLFHIYKNSVGFCYPSIYEGFGLPPLEAMCFDKPVLTSNTTAMREICNGSAILVNPFSVDEIAEGISDMLTKDNSHMIASGRALSSSLSWSNCAEKTWGILIE
ncbi:glycosyltransferase family 4 protein [Photorhabdus laumondii]|uniref:glycosyltransferase family 4 protein n=1 Tax=Photorhabdus laumondii TaxID=2218628 RepID=UPI003314DB05